MGDKFQKSFDQILTNYQYATTDSPAHVELTDATIVGAMEQIMAPRHNQADLIDQLVRVLKFPFAQNLFNQSTLDSLRMALLLPSEMEAFAGKLGGKAFCVACGKQLVQGEMVTVTTGTTNWGKASGIALACQRCVHPTCVASDCCGKKVAFNRKAKNFFEQDILCPTHFQPGGRGLTPPREVETPADVPPDNRTAAETTTPTAGDFIRAMDGGFAGRPDRPPAQWVVRNTNEPAQPRPLQTRPIDRNEIFPTPPQPVRPIQDDALRRLTFDVERFNRIAGIDNGWQTIDVDPPLGDVE
jgi:hypothetical protein